MADLIATLALLSTDEQKYKLSLRFKEGKVYCIFGKDKEERTLFIKGPVQKVSDEIADKAKQFLQMLDGKESEDEEDNDEVEDNLDEIKEEIQDDEKKEADKTAKAEATKAAKTASKTKKVEPVKSVLETITAKLDKVTKASVTRTIDRMKIGTNDPDVTTFLTKSLFDSFTKVETDEGVVKKAIAEIEAIVAEALAGKEEPKKEEAEGMFAQQAPAPEPVKPQPVPVKETPKKAAPITPPPPPVPQQVQPTGSMNIDDDGDLF